MVNSHFALAPVDNCNICIPIKYDSFAFDLGEAAKTIKWHYTVGQARYKPFGERRSEWNAYFTDRKFTSYAREDAHGGIDFAQARFYDSLVGRFLSPDTLVPNLPTRRA